MSPDLFFALGLGCLFGGTVTAAWMVVREWRWSRRRRRPRLYL